MTHLITYATIAGPETMETHAPEHDIACRKAAAAWLAWKAAHPKGCTACMGTGVTEGWYDADIGDGGVDPCPSCTEEGRCPLCGEVQADWITGEREIGPEGPCGQCGWTGLRPGDTCPDGFYTCECGLAEMEEAAREEHASWLADVAAGRIVFCWSCEGTYAVIADAAQGGCPACGAGPEPDAAWYARSDRAYDEARERGSSVRR